MKSRTLVNTICSRIYSFCNEMPSPALCHLRYFNRHELLENLSSHQIQNRSYILFNTCKYWGVPERVFPPLLFSHPHHYFHKILWLISLKGDDKFLIIYSK